MAHHVSRSWRLVLLILQVAAVMATNVTNLFVMGQETITERQVNHYHQHRRHLPMSKWDQALVDCHDDTALCAWGKLVDGVRSITDSNSDAKADQSRITSRLRHKFCIASRKFNIPVAIIEALASRETRIGNYLGTVAGCPPGYGDAANGCPAFGILQVDPSSGLTIAGIPYPKSQAHINQAISLLTSFLQEVANQHPDWDDRYKLKGAAVAYNRGPDSVQTIIDMDDPTADHDYGSDVMTRAYWFSQNSPGC